MGIWSIKVSNYLFLVSGDQFDSPNGPMGNKSVRKDVDDRRKRKNGFPGPSQSGGGWWKPV
jgi:hypothetical protein